MFVNFDFKLSFLFAKVILHRNNRQIMCIDK